jgi:hypothetical protein
MRWPGWLVGLLALVLVTGCLSVKFGRDFQSPEEG